MNNILGIDLGTNSIGLALRENDDFTWYSVYTFRKGVGEGKSGEFSKSINTIPCEIIIFS